MRGYARCSLLTISMLAWTVSAHAVTSDSASSSSTWDWVSNVPSSLMALAGILLLSSLDWLYVQSHKRRAYQRLQRVVALERTFQRRPHYRYHED